MADCTSCLKKLLLLLFFVKCIQGYPCGDPGSVTNARTIFQRQNRLVQYVCNQGYASLGTTLLSCTGGQWRGVKPICVAPGCPPLEVLRNGEKRVKLNGGVVYYSCDDGYELLGSAVMYCDGMRWNDSRPVCNQVGSSSAGGILVPSVSSPAQPSTNNINPPPVVNAAKDLISQYQHHWNQLNKFDGKNSKQKLSFNQSTLTNQLNLGNGVLPDTSKKKVIALHTNSVQSSGTILSSKSPAADGAVRTLTNQGNVRSNTSSVVRLPCPPPRRPQRGYHITKPLPLEYVDDDYVYYIEYHCLPGLTMVSGDNTSYCLRSGKWSGQVPVCEDVQGCVPGFKRSMSGVCKDINECNRNNGGCPDECVNFIGGFTCRCQNGYYLSEDTNSCIDIDECNRGRRFCHHRCTNYPGSYQCSCRRGFVLLSQNNRTCLDVNECLPNGRGACEQICVNTYGSFRCECESGSYRLDEDGRSCSLKCRPGLMPGLNPQNQSATCIDIDECESEELNDCEDICINTFGSYHCNCSRHKVLSSDGHTCTYRSKHVRPADCPEEATECDPCPKESFLQTDVTSSAYLLCVCRAGYHGNPELSIPCTEINECNDGNYGCSHICVNTDGGVHCECPDGYALDTDGRTCSDIDECAENPCENAVCQNFVGSYQCSCHSGFQRVTTNPNRCVNDRVCESLNHPTNGRVLPSQICLNESRLVRGRICLYVCNRGYVVHGSRRTRCMEDGWSEGEPTCEVERRPCKALTNPANGQVLPAKLCLDDQQLRNGRVCLYTCNRGYQLVGSNRRRCGEEGWSGNVPRCVATEHCPPIIRPNNTAVFPSSCFKKSSMRWQLCVFICQAGFSMIGNSTTRCGTNRTWVTPPPQCIRTQAVTPLPFIECPPDVDIDLTEGKPHANVTVLDPVSNMNIIEQRSSGHRAGISFPAGITVIRYTAYSEDRTQQASCDVQIHVRDKTAPSIRRCPKSFTTSTSEQYPNITWEQPLFSDNVRVTSVQLSRAPSGDLTWGTYDVTYRAADEAGNSAQCTFTVTIRPESSSSGCHPPRPPRHGRVTCKSWRTGLLCVAACEDGHKFRDQPPAHSYICVGGRWSPQTRIPDCV